MVFFIRLCSFLILTLLCNSLAIASDVVPGVVVAQSPASTGVFLGSPSILILRSGGYLLSHDTFGDSAQIHTDIYASKDKGKTWERVSTIQALTWASLFSVSGHIYIMGVDSSSGGVVVRRSDDLGRRWTVPNDSASGRLDLPGRFYSGATPVVQAGGRIWRAMDEIKSNGLNPFVLSAPVGADLLKSEAWRASNRLSPNSEWLSGQFKGWLEGNPVVAKDGSVLDLLRVYFNGVPEKAALVHVKNDGREISFDSQEGFIDLFGGGKKFTVKYDVVTGKYLALVNYVGRYKLGMNVERTRNVVALVYSSDIRNWRLGKIMLEHPDSAKHAFQYLDWDIDGEDIVAASRTSYDDAYGGARNQHDSNYITFHVFSSFREWVR